MKLIRDLCLLISTLFLVECSVVPPLPAVPTVIPSATASGCATFSEIRFQQSTKDWLMNTAWPPSALTDFNKISNHNKKWEQLGCKDFKIQKELK